MNNFLKLFIFSLLVAGCSHFGGKSILTVEQKDRFLYNFPSVNPIVESRLRDSVSKDAIIDKKMYLEELHNMNSVKAKETYEALKDFDTIEVRSNSNLMFVCVYSKKFLFGACDSTQCSEAEVRSLGSPNEIESTFEKFSKFACPTKSGKVD